MARTLTVAITMVLSLTAGPPAAPANPPEGALPARPVPGPDDLAVGVLPSLGEAPSCRLELGLEGLDPSARACDDSSPSAGGGSEGAATEAGSAIRLRTRDLVHAARWGAKLAHMSGGRIARVHGFGAVAVHDGEGETLWARSGESLFDDWDLDLWRVPFVLIGSSPLDPFQVVGERPFAVGDLTGDGVDDLAIGHYVQTRNQAGSVAERSILTLLDGVDGSTLWFRTYPGYLTQLLFSGGLLIVGNETGPGRDTLGENGTTTHLEGLRFGSAAGPETVWRWDTGAEWARLLSVEPMGSGRVAVGWTNKPLGESGAPGEIVMLRSETGEAVWDTATLGYPRTLRYDAARDRVTALEQADQAASPDGRCSYWMRGFSASGGVLSAQSNPMGVCAVSFEVADVRGGPEPEWIVGELQQLSRTPAGTLSTTYQAMRVRVVDGTNFSTAWTYAVEMPSENMTGRGPGLASWPVPYALAALSAGGEKHVLVATWHGSGNDGLRALRGSDGQPAWERYGNVTFPLFLLPGRVGDEDAALAVSRNQVLRAVRASDGETVMDVPLLGDFYAAQPFDADDDGITDILTGGESGAVFALDGSHLDDDPGVLWRTTVGSAVHKLELADLTGDGEPELVAATTDGIAAVDPSSGELLWRNDAPGPFTWTFATGDIDGQPGADIATPGRSLMALRGRDGQTLWDFSPNPLRQFFSEPTITPQGQVVAQSRLYMPDRETWPASQVPDLDRQNRVWQVVYGVEGATGSQLWATSNYDDNQLVHLWRSTTAAGPTADGQGTRVAATWVQRMSPAVGGLGMRTDVYDARNGEVLSSWGPLDQDSWVHLGTTWEPGRGLFNFNAMTIRRYEPDPLGVVFEYTSDMAWADFGSLGEALLRMDLPALAAHDPGAAGGSQGTEHPPALDSWRELFVGRMTVADMDGDGSDEILAYFLDYPARQVVVGYSGIGELLVGDYSPHGLAVVEAAG